jgi:hypothetical protein
MTEHDTIMAAPAAGYHVAAFKEGLREISDFIECIADYGVDPALTANARGAIVALGLHHDRAVLTMCRLALRQFMDAALPIIAEFDDYKATGFWRVASAAVDQLAALSSTTH